MIRQLLGAGTLALMVSACAQPDPPPLMSEKGAVELRAMQTRAFETANRPKALRQVIATLQDLGYSVDKVEAHAGTVTATKLAALKLTATVLPGDAKPTLIRANAMVTLGRQQHQVDDPRFYLDDFFSPLAQTLSLDAVDASLMADGATGGSSTHALASSGWSATPAP